MKPSTVEEARILFEASFGNQALSTYVPAKVVGKGEEIVPQTVYEFRVEHDDYYDCTARMYCGFGNALAGRLWQQEAQSLVRFSGKRHPALPRVVDAVFRDENGVGVILSERLGSVMTRENAAELRKYPMLAFRCLSLAADALRTLHDHGLVHRDLWRGSFALVMPEKEGVLPAVCLFGFEMSAFVASLLDPVWRTEASDDEPLKAYRARGGPERRLFRAPEMLRDDGTGTAHLTYRADIYSLGVCAFEWFIGELPQELVRPTSDAPAEPAQIVSTLLKRINEARHVPEPLRDLLRDMIRFEPHIRRTGAEVVNDLVSLQDNIAAAWSTEPTDRRYLVTIAPDFVEQFVQIEAFHDLSADPEERFKELQSLIERDLAGALLVYESGGARGYVQGGKPEAQKEARWVLIGKLGVYFCEEYRRRYAFGETKVIPWALQIKYVVDRGSNEVRDIAVKPLRQRVRAVKIAHYRSSELDPDLGRRDYPLWQPLLDQVRVPTSLPDWTHSFRKGFDWWLKVQGAMLDIRQYAYRRASDYVSPNPKIVRLVWDFERDQQWIETNKLRNLLATSAGPRPAFGDFFDTISDRDLGEEVTWCGDSGGRPGRTEGRTRGRVTEIDRHTVEVHTSEGTLPQAGWLRPADDIASKALVRREVTSASKLFDKPQLMQALYEPRSFPGPRSVWKNAGEGLGGRAPEIVKDMLASFPFYALQGPPGTGKTTVVAHAVKAYLRAKPGARILISAQSHYALDELAERLMRLVEEDKRKDENESDKPMETSNSEIIALRFASEQSLEQVRRSIRDRYLDNVLAEKRVDAIKKGQSLGRNGKSQAAAPPPSDEIRAIRGRWQEIAESSVHEIQDHIWRGANIVFATSGTSTEELLGVQDEFDAFDWVIVEEAAKAWPVELAMPLVLGHRWTLIGDHHQLAAYGLDEMKRIYTLCKTSPRSDIRELVEDSEAFMATLQLFGHFFKNQEKDESQAEVQKERHRQPPVDTLDMQFRMNDAILRVVREAFYPKVRLKSSDELIDGTVRHGLEKPAILKYRALVWLDTSAVRDCLYEKPRWFNLGEANVVRQLVNGIRPSLRHEIKRDRAALAILSPYQQQNQKIKDILHPDFTDFIHTTDSFQGQEAEVVIVSLVRTNPHQGDALKRIGHVGSSQRANVLLSRARKLLVIVGDFGHFRNTIGTVWPTVCETVEKLGAREILPPDLGNLR